jgi:hypothetical protein
LIIMMTGACGKKGPPLPPLVKLPTPPADFLAERRGDVVDLQFTVPAANTDNTRPANVGRVDVYALTARDPLTPDQVVKHGSRVASVSVKAPRDPDRTIDEDEPPADMEPPEGRGLDQGAVARVSEELSAAAVQPVDPPKDKKDRTTDTLDGEGPLAPPRQTPPVRTYVAVGVSPRDRKGPFSKVLTVPLVPPPPAPATPVVEYDEAAIAVKWDPIAGRAPIQAPAGGDVLPSTPIGAAPIAIAYNVYDAGQKPVPVKLTQTPVDTAAYSDNRIAWGEERCYVVRAVEKLAGLTIESEPSPSTCKTLVDTFPPAPPKGLQSSPLEGGVNLIWDASTEKDLAGYIVLRGASADALQAITDAPVQVTTYLDKVPPGERFTYAVKAVDKAGNASRLSNTVEEAAR